MVLPEDQASRRAILRRVLDGQMVVFAVQIHAFFDGKVEDFHTASVREMCDDLIALGYRPKVGLHRNSLLRTVWMHDQPDFLEPLPMPALEDEADCIGEIRAPEDVLADLKRHLDETYGPDNLH